MPAGWVLPGRPWGSGKGGRSAEVVAQEAAWVWVVLSPHRGRAQGPLGRRPGGPFSAATLRCHVVAARAEDEERRSVPFPALGTERAMEECMLLMLLHAAIYSLLLPTPPPIVTQIMLWGSTPLHSAETSLSGQSLYLA